jgi:hypothetical protein
MKLAVFCNAPVSAAIERERPAFAEGFVTVSRQVMAGGNTPVLAFDYTVGWRKTAPASVALLFLVRRFLSSSEKAPA